MHVLKGLLVSAHVAYSWLEVCHLDVASSPCELGFWANIPEASVVSVLAGRARSFCTIQGTGRWILSFDPYHLKP